jgi:hypothetical protein
MASRYGKKAGEKVSKTMHERKRGTLKSGSGKKVKSRKQAIAIGLSEARKAGGKVPSRKASSKKSSSKKASSKKSSTKRKSPARKSAPKKTASAKKSAPKKASSRKKTASRKKKE